MFVNNPHPQPLVFLKGIDLVDLNAIVDFIYTGEASVDQDNFNSFLETAVDLEIEELSSFSSESAKSEIRLGFLQNQDNVEKIEKDVQSKNENQLGIKNSIELDLKDENEKEKKSILYEMDDLDSEAFIELEDNQGTDALLPKQKRQEHEFEYVNHLTGPSYFKRKLTDPCSYACDECGFQSFNSSHLELHAKEQNHNFGRFKCKFCDLKTLRLKTLYAHIEEIHPVERFQCDACEYIGVSYSSLAHHTQYVHHGKSYSCNQCPYKTSALANVDIHKARVHCKSLPVPCDKPSCDYQGNRLALIDHVKRIHKSCKLCGYEPQSVTDKSNHKKIHRFEKCLKP